MHRKRSHAKSVQWAWAHSRSTLNEAEEKRGRKPNGTQNAEKACSVWLLYFPESVFPSNSGNVKHWKSLNFWNFIYYVYHVDTTRAVSYGYIVYNTYTLYQFHMSGISVWIILPSIRVEMMCAGVPLCSDSSRKYCSIHGRHRRKLQSIFHRPERSSICWYGNNADFFLSSHSFYTVYTHIHILATVGIGSYHFLVLSIDCIDIKLTKKILWA